MPANGRFDASPLGAVVAILRLSRLRRWVGGVTVEDCTMRRDLLAMRLAMFNDFIREMNKCCSDRDRRSPPFEVLPNTVPTEAHLAFQPHHHPAPTHFITMFTGLVETIGSKHRRNVFSTRPG